jgi:hypothetical protein
MLVIESGKYPFHGEFAMKILVGRLLLLVMGLMLCFPAGVRAEINSAPAAGQHESPEHDSNKSMKAYKKHLKKDRKQANKTDKKMRKRAKQQRQAGF